MGEEQQEVVDRDFKCHDCYFAPTTLMINACVDKAAKEVGQILSVSFCRFTPTVFMTQQRECFQI